MISLSIAGRQALAIALAATGVALTAQAARAQAEPAATTPEAAPDEGDGGTPPDPDEGLRRFVEAVTSPGTRDGGWLSGIREYIPDAGPVPSSRFR